MARAADDPGPLWIWRPGDLSKSETGSFMGDTRYNAGERLGDIMLAAEKRVGKGRVILFGDTSSFTNNLTVSGHPFTGRLYAYLASANAGNPQTAWRQAAGGLLLMAALALVLVYRRPLALVVVAVAFGGAVWICSVATMAANEVLPVGRAYIPPSDSNDPAGDAAASRNTSGDAAKKDDAAAARAKYRGPNNLAYIDAAHHSAASDESLRPDGIMGMTYMLMRHHYLALVPELTAERLMNQPDERDFNLGVDSLKRGLIVAIAPQRPYTDRELNVLDEFIARGGRFILMVAADDAGPVKPLLERFQLQVGVYGSPRAYGVAGQPPNTPGFDLTGQPTREPTPLGHFKSPLQRPRRPSPRPMASPRPSSTTLRSCVFMRAGPLHPPTRVHLSSRNMAANCR